MIPMGTLLRTRRRHKLWLHGKGYRLQFRLATRVLWSALLVATIILFAPAAVSGVVGLWWRLLAAVMTLAAVSGIRVMWGAAVVIGHSGMRIYRPWWPLHRDIDWYRILATDIVPGFWFLEIEMNSGERIELPCVEHMDELFEQIEDHRTRLDIID